MTIKGTSIDNVIRFCMLVYIYLFTMNIISAFVMFLTLSVLADYVPENEGSNSYFNYATKIASARKITKKRNSQSR